MNKQDYRKENQKRRRLVAMQSSYIFLDEWYKNDIWVGNVVHYHKPFSEQGHSFIVSRARASAKDKTIYAFDIETGRQLCKADDILSLAGAMSTKGLEITGVDKSYKCPFKLIRFLDIYLPNSPTALKEDDMDGVSTGSIVLTKYGEKVISYLVGYSERDSINLLYGTSTTEYLIDLSNGVIEETAGNPAAFYSILNIIAERKNKKPKKTHYPVILGTLGGNNGSN